MRNAGRPGLAASTAAIALALGTTCDWRPLPLPTGLPYSESVMVFEPDAANDLDLLFVIDNSRSMEREQSNLVRNFPVFMQALKKLPGGLPNMHVGVVTTDLGAGHSVVGGCPVGGDRGVLQIAPRGMGGRCTALPKDGHRFLTTAENGARNNFDGDISDAFSCIAQVGTKGCGVEHVIEAGRVALGGGSRGALAENAGFLRKTAALAVIYITDEDDCSAPPASNLFREGVSNLTCATLGHLCGGSPPERGVDRTYTDCHANENGPFIRISEQVKFVKSLKRNPNRILISAIAGPRDPYRVLGDSLATSCMNPNADATPAVRMRDFVDSFGDNGAFVSICEDDFGVALEGIAKRLGERLYSQCLPCPLIDADPEAPGVQADCLVEDETLTPAGKKTRLMPVCDGRTTTGCWHLVEDAGECRASGVKLTVEREPDAVEPDTLTIARCATCPDPADPRCRR